MAGVTQFRLRVTATTGKEGRARRSIGGRLMWRLGGATRRMTELRMRVRGWKFGWLLKTELTARNRDWVRVFCLVAEEAGEQFMCVQEVLHVFMSRNSLLGRYVLLLCARFTSGAQCAVRR